MNYPMLISLEDFKTDCLAFLIPEYNTDEEAKRYIDNIYEDIFDELLFGWCTEESRFPKDRTNDMFWRWFEVELHSVVIDSSKQPILKNKCEQYSSPNSEECSRR